MIAWRVARHGTANPVEVMDGNQVVLRVYDWTREWQLEQEHILNKYSLSRLRFLNNLRKAGMIILAMKMMETNGELRD